MTIDNNKITLETVSIRLDSKKITNAILDQIPRKDFCDLFFDEEGDFSENDGIEIVCRFSLVSLLSSERRIYKIGGYDTVQTYRAIKKYDHQSDAFFFTVEGQLYCDSFSSKTGTKRYGEYHEKLKDKARSAEYQLKHVSQVLELHKQGIEPLEVAKNFNYSEFNYGDSSLPQGLPRRIRRTKSSTKNESIFDDWENDFDDWEDDLETKQSNELNRIIKKFGTWPNYIKELKIEFQECELEKNKYEKYISDYENRVTELINDIQSKPFTLLGC